MSKYIKYIPTIDRTDLPPQVKGWLDQWVQIDDMIQANNSYFEVDIAEYRQHLKEDTMDEYAGAYGQNKVLFMEWLEKQTSADEVLILYWW